MKIITNVPTMVPSYALTVMAYAQSYTHYYLLDKYTREDKKENE